MSTSNTYFRNYKITRPIFQNERYISQKSVLELKDFGVCGMLRIDWSNYFLID